MMQSTTNNVLAPTMFSTLIESPFLLNSVLISRNDVSSSSSEEDGEGEHHHEEEEEESSSGLDGKSLSDKDELNNNNKHVGEYMKNLYVNNKEDDDEDYIKKSQDLMKSIRNGRVIEYEDVSNGHLSFPRDTIVTGKDGEIGSDRFVVKPEVSEKSSSEQPKKEKKERRDSDSSIIDTIFSPFYWMIGSSNTSKRNVDQHEKKLSNEKKPNEKTDAISSNNSESNQSSAKTNTEKIADPEEKKSDSSIISTIFSSGIFSKKSSESKKQETEPEKKERKERRNKSSPLAWIERFGADAGKAASNALKDPLERLASSPVLATGEVIVVHSLDLDGIDFRRIFKYFIFMIFTWRFSNTFFGSIFPALMGRSVKRRIEHQPTHQITYIPQASPYPSISVLPNRNTITQL